MPIDQQVFNNTLREQARIELQVINHRIPILQERLFRLDSAIYHEDDGTEATAPLIQELTRMRIRISDYLTELNRMRYHIITTGLPVNLNLG